MERNIVIAFVTAALLGGGATTALALSEEERPTRAAQAETGDDRTSAQRVSAEQAIDAALKARPGTAVAVTSHYDDGDHGWEVEILDRAADLHTVHVDPVSGEILGRETDRDDDGHEYRDVLEGARITAAQAAETAAAKGFVTSVALDDRDDDGLAGWEVETADGRDWEVDLRTGALTADREDADRGIRVGQDDDSYNDDRRDDDGDRDDDHDDADDAYDD